MTKRRKSKTKSKPRASTVTRKDRTEYEKLKNGHLDTTQASAAEYVEGLFLRSQIGGQGIDPTKPYIDGGKGYYDIPDLVIEYNHRINEVRSVLGKTDYMVVRMFIAEGATAGQVADAMKRPGPRGEYVARCRFRDALDNVAELAFPKHKSSRRRSYYARDGKAQIDDSEWVKE